MKLDEIRAEGRIRPEAGLRAFEETGTTPAPDWAHCGIAAVAAACGVRNSEIFEIIGTLYKDGYVDGFDGRSVRRVLVLGIMDRLLPGSAARYRAGLEDGVALRRALRAGAETEELATASLDEDLAELRGYGCVLH